MPKHPKFIVACSVILSLSLLASGCSPTSDGSSGATASSEKSTSLGATSASVIKTVSKDAKLYGQLPKRIKDSGKLVIGAGFHSVPDHYYAEDGKTPVGDEVDLAKALGKKLGIDIEFKDLAFDALITSLQSKRIDVIWSGMTDNEERQQKIDFVDYLNTGLVATVQKGNPKNIKGIDDLCGHKLALVKGSGQVQVAEDASKQCEADGKKPIDTVLTDNLDDNEVQLASGRIDAIINDSVTASYLANTYKNGKAFEVVKAEPVDAGPLGVGVRKDDAQLRDVIQAGLQELVDEGSYGKILSSWDLKTSEVNKITVNLDK